MFTLSKEELKNMGAIITTEEIKQQPKLWEEAYTIYVSMKEELNEFINDFAAKADEKVRVVFTGAGTSEYVGDTLVPYLNKAGDTKRFIFESIGTTDIVASPEDYLHADEPTILVSFARSGNSPESLATVEIANHVVKDIRHIAVTCAPEGMLAKNAAADSNSILYLMPAGANDQGFAMTGSFSCMTLGTLLLFDQSAADAEKQQFVETMATMGRSVVQREADIQAIVDLPFQRIVYLGSGSLAGLTREAQLKVLELTAGKIATVFDSSLGFRHGPKSFVNEETLLFVFVNNDEYTRQYDLDILHEVQGDKIARKITGIAQPHPTMNYAGDTFAFAADLPSLPEGYLALPFQMVAQTVSLLASIKVGNTPDTPSPTGTVNRVVKGVTIHPFK